MKFSIVTISFNQAEYLESAIQSVINQKGVDLEYILVDSGSTDGSREIIEKYKNVINKIIFEKDCGPSDGLNKGFAYATGDIYGYLNSDDVLLPDSLKEVGKYFKDNQEIDVLSGHCFVIDSKGNVIQKAFSHKFSIDGYLQKYSVLIQQSTFFKKELFEKFGGFNVNNRITWDGELMLKFASNKAKFKVVNKFWSCFRIYEFSITGSKDYNKKISDDYEKLRKVYGFKNQSMIKAKLNYLFFWFKQPSILLLRIIDQLIHPRRII